LIKLPYLLHRRPLSIVERILVRGIEIDQPSDSIRMAGADGAQFFTAERVPREYRSLEFEQVQDSEHIVTQAIRIVRRAGAGRAETTPGNTVDMVTRTEFGREIIENVSRTSEPG
jgi:hypothetical protein